MFKFMRFASIVALLIITMACHSTKGSEGDMSFSLSPSEVFELEEDWIGETVTVVGTVMPGNLICTQIGCLEDNPCCNGCSGTLDLLDADTEFVSDGITLRASDGVEGDFECAGNECEQSCDPLAINETYEVTGTLEIDEDETYFISVESYARVTE